MNDYLSAQNARYAAALAEVFAEWERRGRGWQVWDYAVNLEPVFSPVAPPATQIVVPVRDDARVQRGWQRLFVSNQNPQITGNNDNLREEAVKNADNIKPSAFYRTEKVSEIQILLPPDLRTSPALTEQFWLSLTSSPSPLGFELVADASQIIVQIACNAGYVSHLKNQLQTFFPSLYLSEQKDFLTSRFDYSHPVAIADFGLSRNFLFPLQNFRSFNPDPLTGLVSSLGSLQANEKVLFQILFQKTRMAWTEELQKLQGNPQFRKILQEKNPTVLAALREKLSSPLFAVVLRLAAQSANRQDSFDILKRVGANLTQFSSPGSNELIALSNDDYPKNNHFLASLTRTSYRSGMLLNAEELAALAHLPSDSVKVEKLKRDELKTKAAPAIAFGHRSILGENLHNGQSRSVSLSNRQRTRHLHIIGSTGSGKSNLLLNLIKQDLDTGEGLCVIDPHGDLIDEVISNVPDTRAQDMVLFDPSDSEFPIGFNILQANSELEKTILSSDLIATFRRMSTSWGDVMDSVLANAVLAFVESTRGGTLFELKRFLVEKNFRAEFLESVEDYAIRYFWQNEFPLIAGKPQSSIIIRLDAFLRQKLVRNVVCQKNNKINFREIMDTRKVLLIKLSQGLIGEENAYLLGTLLVSKLYQTALSRQDTSNRPYFWLYMDEFHHFITPSMESVLSGVRKYNLGLTLAHQEFRQLQSRSLEVASSVLSNCYTRICFRLGDADAERFAGGFSFFDAKALQNLGVGEAVARIERAEYDFNLKTFLLPKVDKELAGQRKNNIVGITRARYAAERAEVEEKLRVPQPSETITAAASKSKTEKSESSSVNVPQDKEKAESNILDLSPAFTREEKSAALSAIASLPQKDAVSDKGNQQHKYLQSLVKRIAESRGFLATIEKEVFGGAGRIDVALENENSRIACEISVTNNPDYEVQNIRKCLAAGFAPVVVLSADLRHLDKIKQNAKENLSEEDFVKVEFFTPEEFHLWLENLATEPVEKQEKVKGFRVNVKLKPIDEGERSTRKKAISNVVFGALKKLKKGGEDQ
jgi:hypothetical protein